MEQSNKIEIPKSNTETEQSPCKNLTDFEPVDLSLYTQNDGASESLCRRVAESLCEFGILIVRDPSINFSDNEKFIRMMEKYFERPTEEKIKDSRPEVFHEVGTTPSYTEKPRPRCKLVSTYPRDQKPLTLCPPLADPKWRFFWRIGPRPEKTDFPQLNFSPVVPKDFPEWETTMNAWGNRLLRAAKIVAEMAAVGFGMEKNVFTDRMEMAPHLLGPTGCDLKKYGEKGTVFAGFHQDLDFLTIHGKSNFPGLYVWLRNNQKILVKVPDGCLLVQAGMMFERLTAGKVLAGFHEVVVCDETIETMKRKKEKGESLWRVSSSLFGHIASDVILKPLPPFEDPLGLYPPIKAGDHVIKELKAISLAA